MKKIRNLLIILTLVILSFGIGLNTGKNEKRIVTVKSESIAIGDKSKEKGLDFSLFWEVWDRLNIQYLEKKALVPQKMIYGAISGMVASLDDPYTVFLPPDQNKEVKDDLGGKFEGIGAQLGIKDKKIVVIAPLKKSPAEEAGIKAEDWILKVDGKETINWTLPETVSKIRGPKGSKVLLTVLHKDAQKSEDINVVRGEIKVSSVELDEVFVECQNKAGDSELLCIKKDTFCESCQVVYYLKLGRFGDTTNDEWTKTIEEIVKRQTKLSENKRLGVVLDLRNNPGGHLSGSVFIASEFLSDGTVVIQQSSDGIKKNYKVDRAGKLINVPLVVLINKGSASASEIVAGALSVRKNVPLVGETSFGKGTIQEAQELKEGAGIHITTAKWLLPDSTNINGDGISPKYKIENDENDPDSDKQLEKAIDVLYQN